MPAHFADRLLSAIAAKGSPVCVGVDPAYGSLPAELKAHAADEVAAIRAFSLEVVKLVADIVPAVKPQIAYFERYGAAGVAAYEGVVAAAHSAGLVVIGDVKRGDIGSTAAEYAAGHLSRPNGPDAVTINGYFGADGIEPFLKVGLPLGRGAFVLVRTSNPSAAILQDFADPTGKKFYEHIAGEVARIGSAEGLVGQSGYSALGAVVGATYPEEARRLRRIMPQQIFLVPGYGAQGATAADCAAAFKPDGTGALVNASRSVLYAFAKGPFAGSDWRKSIVAAAGAFAKDIREALGKSQV